MVPTYTFVNVYHPLIQRRLSYLKHILNRDSDELLKKVFLVQKNNPTRGDFIKLVEKDLTDLGITYEQVISSKMTKQKLKKLQGIPLLIKY